jgi:AbrB family looped-hinge helix DNA binding protein
VGNIKNTGGRSKSRQGRKGFAEEPQALLARTSPRPLPARMEADKPLLSEAREARVRAAVRVGAGGRVVIPAEVRAALQVKDGDRLALEVLGDELLITPQWVGIRRAQEIVCSVVPADVSLADQVIEDRRREAELEERGG